MSQPVRITPQGTQVDEVCLPATIVP